MKIKISVLLISILLISYTGYNQDSVRTKNDKPGTPSSLRTPDNSPQNQNHVINTSRPQDQNINHGGTESNKIVPETNKQRINEPSANGTIIQQNPATNDNLSVHTDSTTNNGSLYNKPANVTNPVRKGN